MECVEFSEWIEKKFLEWRKDRYGKGTSVAEFAKTFGVSQQLMSSWMKKGGVEPKHTKYINALAAVYGSEVYEILGLEPPVQSGLNLPGSFPPEFKSRLESAVAEINATLAARGIVEDSPAAYALAAEIFAKHGLTVKVTTQ